MGICILNSSSETIFWSDPDHPSTASMHGEAPLHIGSPYSRPCRHSLCSDFSLGFHPQILAAEHGWLFGKENSTCSLLLAPCSANPKATQSLWQRPGERWWWEFTACPRKGDLYLSSPCPADIKDITGFPTRVREEEVCFSVPLSGDCSVVRGWVSCFR